MTYPNTAGYAKHSKTSKEAAERLISKKPISDTIMKVLHNIGHQGLTVDEAKVHCEIEHGRKYDRTTIGARFTELCHKNLIKKTDRERKTPHNRMATVYVRSEFFQKSMAIAKGKNTPTEKLKSADQLARALSKYIDFSFISSMEKSLLSTLAEEAGLDWRPDKR